MAKLSGIPTSFTIDDVGGTPVTFSNEVGTVTLNSSRAVQDVSGLDSDGTERLALRGDHTVDFNGFWDPSTVIGVFGDLSNERDLIIAFPGPATWTGAVVLTSFNVARGADGSLGWTATGQMSDGSFGAWS